MHRRWLAREELHIGRDFILDNITDIQLTDPAAATPLAIFLSGPLLPHYREGAWLVELVPVRPFDYTAVGEQKRAAGADPGHSLRPD